MLGDRKTKTNKKRRLKKEKEEKGKTIVGSFTLHKTGLCSNDKDEKKKKIEIGKI